MILNKITEIIEDLKTTRSILLVLDELKILLIWVRVGWPVFMEEAGTFGCMCLLIFTNP